ncbi:glycosyltransferase family 2 protein [Aquabacterium olei]|nr:glycosyltransferase family 2 protein [Aquabacterium olei]
MPTYNGGAYLREAIESVMRQRYQQWELLVSDDGSSDGTRDYLLQLKDPRIRVFLQEKNLGIFGNLNFLFQQVKTDIVQILCQDDWLTDEYALESCLNEWSILPEDVAFMRANHGSDFSSKDGGAFEAQWLPRIVDPGISDLYFLMFGCIPGNLSNVSLRTEIVAKHGWFDQRLPYAGDFDFWSRVGRSQRWVVSAVRVSTIRTHQNQASKTLNKVGELMPQMGELLRRLYSKVDERGLIDWRVRVAMQIVYVSQQRWAGLRSRMKTGSWSYMKHVNKYIGRGPWEIGVVFGWLIFLLSGGGRWFKKAAIGAVLSRHQGHLVR